MKDICHQHPLPTPPYPVGTTVRPTLNDFGWVAIPKDDRRYYFNQVVRMMKGHLRRTLHSLKKGGYTKGAWIDAHNRKRLMDALRAFCTADAYEIAGWAPGGMHVQGGWLAHASCLNGVQGAMSGMEYEPYILARKFMDGRHQIVLLPEPLSVWQHHYEATSKAYIYKLLHQGKLSLK